MNKSNKKHHKNKPKEKPVEDLQKLFERKNLLNRVLKKLIDEINRMTEREKNS